MDRISIGTTCRHSYSPKLAKTKRRSIASQCSAVFVHCQFAVDSFNLSASTSDYGTPLPLRPSRKKTTHITRNTKNRTFAIPADAAAIPPNPKTAAISAIIRKVIAHPNIYISPPQARNRMAPLICVPSTFQSSSQGHLILIIYGFAGTRCRTRIDDFALQSIKARWEAGEASTARQPQPNASP